MQEYCHTCGGALPASSGESPFCPHCGAPQLMLSLDFQSAETGGTAAGEAAGAATTGMRPPPRPQQVDWKLAIRCAAVVACVAGVLSAAATWVQMLSPVSTLWILSGSLITLGLYQKRRPTAWMDVRVGASIGVVVGLCLTVGVAIAMAIAGLVARYGLHSMASFDAQMAEQIQTVQRSMQQSAAPAPADFARFIASPEFRGGIMLSGFAFATLFLIVLSTVCGAFAGLLRMRRKSTV